MPIFFFHPFEEEGNLTEQIPRGRVLAPIAWSLCVRMTTVTRKGILIQKTLLEQGTGSNPDTNFSLHVFRRFLVIFSTYIFCLGCKGAALERRLETRKVSHFVEVMVMVELLSTTSFSRENHTPFQSRARNE